MEIRRSYDRLISTLGFPILVRCLYIESGPRTGLILGLPRERVSKARARLHESTDCKNVLVSTIVIVQIFFALCSLTT